MNDTNKPPALEGLLTLEEAAAWVSFYEEEALSPRAALHRLRSIDNKATPESVLVAMPAGTVLSEPPMFEPGDPLPRPLMYLVGGGMLAGFLEDLEVHGEAVPPMLVAHVGTRRWQTDTPVLMSALRLTPSQVKSLSPWSALSRAVLRGEVDIEDEPSASINAENPAQPAPASEQAAETQEQRQARRYKLCVDSGLVMPTNDYDHLPRGISGLAEREGITRQAFTEDVKKHINRINGR